MPCLLLLKATATTDSYTLSLHDALPIWAVPGGRPHLGAGIGRGRIAGVVCGAGGEQRDRRNDPELRHHHRRMVPPRSEEHTSELQSQFHLVCRLLLEKKKNRTIH